MCWDTSGLELCQEKDVFFDLIFFILWVGVYSQQNCMS